MQMCATVVSKHRFAESLRPATVSSELAAAGARRFLSGTFPPRTLPGRGRADANQNYRKHRVWLSKYKQTDCVFAAAYTSFGQSNPRAPPSSPEQPVCGKAGVGKSVSLLAGGSVGFGGLTEGGSPRRAPRRAARPSWGLRSPLSPRRRLLRRHRDTRDSPASPVSERRSPCWDGACPRPMSPEPWQFFPFSPGHRTYGRVFKPGLPPWL